MRFGILITVGWITLASSTQQDPAALVKAGISAHGGRDRLAKLLRVYWKAQNTFHDPDGTNSTFVSEHWFEHPFHQRYAAVIPLKGKQFHILTTHNNASGWLTINGAAKQLSEVELKSMKEKCFAWTARTLYPLLDDSDVALMALGERQLADNAALGIRVKSQNHWEMELYFAKDTHLLVGMASDELSTSGVKMNWLTTFSGYKDVGGLKVPTKMTSVSADGKNKSSQEVIELTLMNEMDKGLFTGPK